MAKAWCGGWGQEVEIPAGISSGGLFDCPNWAGLTLRASVTDGKWTVREVKKASCAVGDEVVVLPDNVRPGDVIECHGARQRVTYEFGAYALVRLEGWARRSKPSGLKSCWTRSSSPNGRNAGGLIPSLARRSGRSSTGSSPEEGR